MSGIGWVFWILSDFRELSLCGPYGLDYISKWLQCFYFFADYRTLPLLWAQTNLIKAKILKIYGAEVFVVWKRCFPLFCVSTTDIFPISKPCIDIGFWILSDFRELSFCGVCFYLNLTSEAILNNWVSFYQDMHQST